MRIFKPAPTLVQKLAVPLLGLLLLLPLLHFYQVIQNLVQIEERQLEALAREKLLLEAEAFQNDLNPEEFIEFSLRQMNRHFNLSPSSSNNRLLRYPNGYDPALVNDQFIASASAYLKENFHFAPSLFIAADCDLKNHYSYYASGLLKDAQVRRDFTKVAILSTAFDESFLRNLLPDTLSLEKIRHHYLRIYKRDNFHLTFADLFRKHVSYFSNPEHYPDTCTKIFSNHFGNQRAYNYAFKIQRHFPDGWEGLYGLYYLVIFGYDVSPQMILKSALARKSNEAGRKIIREQVIQPHFRRTAKGLYYLANLTTAWFQTINDYAAQNPASEAPFKEFFKTHSICTFLDNSHLVSDSRKLLPILSFSLKLLFLLVFAIAVTAWLRPVNFTTSLSWKLRLAISIIVLIPISLIFATIHLVQTVSDRSRTVKFQTFMHRQLRQFENLEAEQHSRITFRFLQKKKIDTGFFSQKNPDLRVMSRNHDDLDNDELGMLSLFLNKEGQSYSFERDLKENPRGQKTETVGLFKILNGLGYSNDLSAKNRKLMKEQYLYGSFADAFWNVFATAEALASENEIIHDFFSVSSLKKSLFQLLAAPSQPHEPFAVYYHEINDVRTTRQLINFFKQQQKIKASISLDTGSVDFGIFARSTFGLRKEHWPAFTSSSKELKEMAEMAVSQRTSGSITQKKDNSTELSTWIFKEDSPLIFVARARFLNNRSIGASLDLLAWLIMLYSLITIIFISNGLSAIFLGPVRLLLLGVDQIKQRCHNFYLEVSSKDEFAELATTFNRMNNGLLQREKMRRFVSDKLIDNLSVSEAGCTTETRILEVVVLSSDIRGFTTLTEKSKPEEIVALLNDYLTMMEKAIKNHNGSIDKIVGDAIIATFSDSEQHENMINACKAGLAMRDSLKEFNRQRLAQGLNCIENGVGIATGTVIIGIAGQQERRRELVMVGKAFHTAEELEAMSKLGKGTKVIVDTRIKSSLQPSFDFQPLQSEGAAFEAWEIIR